MFCGISRSSEALHKKFLANFECCCSKLKLFFAKTFKGIRDSFGNFLIHENQLNLEKFEAPFDLEILIYSRVLYIVVVNTPYCFCHESNDNIQLMYALTHFWIIFTQIS